MDFACKNIPIDQLLKCSLGISKAGCALLQELREENAWLLSEDLTKKTSYDQATVQRVLKQLYERGVLERRQQNRTQGGYEYLYKIISKRKFEQLIGEVIDNWSLTAKKELKEWI